MKIFCHIRKFFNTFFALYTCISFGMMICNRALAIEEAPTWGGVALLFGQIALFCAMCSLAVTLLDIPEKLNRALSHILKFIISYGAFYLCFFVLVKASAEPINIVVISTMFVIVYAATAVLAGLFAKLASPKLPAQEYENIYTKE